MIKLESVTTNNVLLNNSIGFSYEFNRNQITCIHSESLVKINDLLNSMTGFIRIKTGKIYIDNFSLTELSSYEKALAFNQTCCLIDTIDKSEFNLSIKKAIELYLRLLGIDVKKQTEKIEQAFALFNIQNIVNKKIIDLSDYEKISYLFAKAYSTDLRNIFINLNKNLIFDENMRAFAFSQISKFNKEPHEIIVFSTNIAFAKMFEYQVDLDDLQKTYLLENLLVTDNPKKDFKSYKITSYNSGLRLFMHGQIGFYIVTWVAAIFILFGCFITTSLFMYDQSSAAINKSILVTVVVLFAIIVLAFFCLCNVKIYLKWRNNLAFLHHLNIPKQIMFSYLPVVTFLFWLSSFIVALLMQLIISQIIYNQVFFYWPAIWVSVATYFVIMLFIGFVTSLSLINKLK